MPDGDDVSVALIDPPTPRAPILTIFHGLEGTVRSTYAQGLMHQARRRGWLVPFNMLRTGGYTADQLCAKKLIHKLSDFETSR